MEIGYNQFILKGAVKSVGEVQFVGKKGTAKRTIVLDTGMTYANPISVDCIGQRIVDATSAMAVGDRIEALCDIRGREWNNGAETKVYNSINLLDFEAFEIVRRPKATKSEPTTAPTAEPMPTQTQGNTPIADDNAPISNDDVDGLPF